MYVVVTIVVHLKYYYYYLILYFSEMFGLSLIMTDVDESGPAWSCGIRPGRNYN